MAKTHWLRIVSKSYLLTIQNPPSEFRQFLRNLRYSKSGKLNHLGLAPPSGFVAYVPGEPGIL